MTQYLDRQSVSLFGQTSSENLNATDRYWAGYLSAPTTECESYKNLFLEPSQRKFEFITVCRNGKEFVASLKDSTISIDRKKNEIVINARNGNVYRWELDKSVAVELDQKMPGRPLQFDLSPRSTIFN